MIYFLKIVILVTILMTSDFAPGKGIKRNPLLKNKIKKMMGGGVDLKDQCNNSIEIADNLHRAN